jgi:DnaJ-class molecular chaperone
VIEGEGMPIKLSAEKGNLYIKINVNIPEFSQEELNFLEDFFQKKREDE